MMKFPVKLQYGGSTHCTLRYLKMKKSAVSAEDLMVMFPTKFYQRYIARRAMSTLSKYGYAKELGDSIEITPLGTQYLSSVAKQYVGEFK